MSKKSISPAQPRKATVGEKLHAKRFFTETGIGLATGDNPTTQVTLWPDSNVRVTHQNKGSIGETHDYCVALRDKKLILVPTSDAELKRVLVSDLAVASIVEVFSTPELVKEAA